MEFRIGSVYTLKENLAIYFENINGQAINQTIEYNQGSCFDVISIDSGNNSIVVEFEADYNNMINDRDIHVTLDINILTQYTEQ